MLSVLNVVAPVFALIALGYAAVRLRIYPREGVGGLISFVNTFAAPCLLFRAMLTVDFGAAFNPAIIGSFYLGAVLMMIFGALAARRIFGRSPGEAVAVGFAAMFTNTVLVGLPIMQRAYGEDAMPVVYSIIGLHAPLLMTGGMLYMELARRDGGKLSTALLQGVRSAVTNPLLIGIALGVAGNLLGIRLVGVLEDTTLLLASSVMPVALFGLGGALNEYKLAENLSQAAVMSALKLIAHPLIAWVVMVPILGVDPHIARYGVLLAGMPTGINAYIFATYYSRSIDVATNTILLSTVASVITISAWLLLLGP
ncbi:AEC family transporter [Pelagibacterium xiamenense]|uniref:AEC family transporter n=1 Tax=Pelagibacterium xiamenense TaxID=2901140 RepID=UPI001E462FC6|nr:AEC family transporter [Pelagibacterium xiamenense]MCD7059169.1 AEC family transporter [Pelagibacterium xiamenense]